MVPWPLPDLQSERRAPCVYVCICNAVTDDEVLTAVDSGAHCIDTVAAATRAGSTCGSCHDTIDDLIAERCGTCPLASLSLATTGAAARVA